MDLEWATTRAAALTVFLDRHRALSSALIKAFFLEDHWHTCLPQEWHVPLEALTLEQLADMLESPLPPSGAEAWPPSLSDFFESAHSLRLPGQLDPRGSRDATSAAATRWKSASGRCAEEEQMDTALRDSVKPKKMHEIVHLSQLVDSVADGAGCTQLVDVGSGLGYLSRTLAYEYNWPVVAVDSSRQNVDTAALIDKKVQKKLRRRMLDERGCSWDPEGGGTLRHVAARLAPDCTPEEFWATLASEAEVEAGVEALDAELEAELDAELEAEVEAEMEAASAVAASAAAEVAEVTERVAASVGSHANVVSALVGLHTCGDLGPTMLRVFHHAGPAVGALISVGCCYMHLSEPGAKSDRAQADRQVAAGEAGGVAGDVASGEAVEVPDRKSVV